MILVRLRMLLSLGCGHDALDLVVLHAFTTKSCVSDLVQSANLIHEFV